MIAVTLLLALSSAPRATPDYSSAIACAAGEIVLAQMRGGQQADSADRATIERLGMLARDWARTAQGLAIDPATVPADIARSRDALQRELASQHDAVALAARLDRHLARCALPPRAPDAAAS